MCLWAGGENLMFQHVVQAFMIWVYGNMVIVVNFQPNLRRNCVFSWRLMLPFYLLARWSTLYHRINRELSWVDWTTVDLVATLSMIVPTPLRLAALFLTVQDQKRTNSSRQFKRQKSRDTNSCSHVLSNHVWGNASVSYHKMLFGHLPPSVWQAGLREVVVLTELIAGGRKRGRSDLSHPILAPKPAVAIDPLHGQQIRHIFSRMQYIKVILKLVMRKYKPYWEQAFPSSPTANVESRSLNVEVWGEWPGGNTICDKKIKIIN